MKSAIAHTFLYQLIIIYVVIVFGIIMASVNYYKAFKVNNRVISSIEKFEGYNDLARADIDNTLSAIGYTKHSTSSCPTRNGIEPMSNGSLDYPICVYYYPSDVSKKEKEGTYYNYSVVSYIYVDIPYLDKFRIPVHTKAERIYKFNDGVDSK